jgi:hypothetical protein
MPATVQLSVCRVVRCSQCYPGFAGVLTKPSACGGCCGERWGSQALGKTRIQAEAHFTQPGNSFPTKMCLDFGRDRAYHELLCIICVRGGRKCHDRVLWQVTVLPCRKDKAGSYKASLTDITARATMIISPSGTNIRY